MEMIIAGAGVPSIANVPDRLALRYRASFLQTVGIAIQMGVVVDKLFVAAQLVDGVAAVLTLKQSHDLAVGSREHRCSLRGRNVDGVVHASRTTRGGKC